MKGVQVLLASTLAQSGAAFTVPRTAVCRQTSLHAAPPTTPTMPSHSPATDLQNQIYGWRGYDVRYQVSGPLDADHTLLLVHGLFVNSDHWRKMLNGLSAKNHEDEHGKTYRVYAVDLFGSGWSSKPSRDDRKAQQVNGENGRFYEDKSQCFREANDVPSGLKKFRSKPTLNNVPLGTAAGGNRLATSLDLRHPLRSPYNFYTWSEQLADFTREVIQADADGEKKVTLVANSIGTMSSLQAVLDEPNLFNGCFVINPNYRELHMAEVPFSSVSMPLVRQVQSLLRSRGHGLFKTLATPETVKQILNEPYAVSEAVDDELVSVLLDPLLTEGADDVVFDTLSYSAGPLPEQQLSSPDFPDVPVWVAYGQEDPWTPPRRVESLQKVVERIRDGDEEPTSPVKRVIPLEGAGHCPHDEVPELVNNLVIEFLNSL